MLGGIGAAAAWAVYQRQGAALQVRFSARADNQADIAEEVARLEQLLAA